MADAHVFAFSVWHEEVNDLLRPYYMCKDTLSDENIPSWDDLKLTILDRSRIKKFVSKIPAKNLYFECIEDSELPAADSSPDRKITRQTWKDGFFLEDKSSEVQEKKKYLKVDDLKGLIIWTDDDIKNEVKNLGEDICDNTGILGKAAKGIGLSFLTRQMSNAVTGGIDNFLLPETYFRNLLFARRGKAQAKEAGGGLKAAIQVDAGFATNMLDYFK